MRYLPRQPNTQQKTVKGINKVLFLEGIRRRVPINLSLRPAPLILSPSWAGSRVYTVVPFIDTILYFFLSSLIELFSDLNRNRDHKHRPTRDIYTTQGACIVLQSHYQVYTQPFAFYAHIHTRHVTHRHQSEHWGRAKLYIGFTRTKRNYLSLEEEGAMHAYKHTNIEKTQDTTSFHRSFKEC